MEILEYDHQYEFEKIFIVYFQIVFYVLCFTSIHILLSKIILTLDNSNF